MCGHLSVADNIFIGRAHKRGIFIDDAMMHREAKKILDDLGIDLNTHTMVGELSVAQQQMVEIAKAISFNSKILVLDEPTATLTEREIDQLFEIIKRLQAKGVGMVYISHRMAELGRICERASVIRDGQYIGTVYLKDVTMDELVNMIVGRPLETNTPSTPAPSATSCWRPKTSTGAPRSTSTTSTSARARSWASPAWWAPAAPS